MNENIFIGKISNILSKLFSKKNETLDYISFLGGTSGISLFLFYASQFTKSEKEYTHAFTILEETVTVYNQTAIAPPSLPSPVQVFRTGLCGSETWTITKSHIGTSHARRLCAGSFSPLKTWTQLVKICPISFQK